MQNNDQESVLTEVQGFVESEIKPFASDFDTNQQIPRSLIKKMAERGYLAANFPKEYGGLQLDPIHYGRFTEMIAKGCSSTRAMITVHSSLVGETLMRWGSSDQKDTLLPLLAKGEKMAAFAQSEPNVGSDAKNVQTSYRPDGGEYIINGVKKWITLGAIADIFLVIASNNKDTTAFLIDKETEGVEVQSMDNLMASRASFTAEIQFNDVKVSPENILGSEGGGFSYIANTALDHGRYSIAWGGLGIAQAALNAMVSYARKRKQFGKGLYEFQLIQGMIGDAVTKLEAGRALCMNAGQMRMVKDTDAIMQTTIAKYFTSKIANEVAADAVQIHGGNGFSTQFPAERLFREAKLMEVIEGTSQVLQQTIAMHGLNKFNNTF